MIQECFFQHSSNPMLCSLIISFNKSFNNSATLLLVLLLKLLLLLLTLKLDKVYLVRSSLARGALPAAEECNQEATAGWLAPTSSSLVATSKASSLLAAGNCSQEGCSENYLFNFSLKIITRKIIFFLVFYFFPKTKKKNFL